MTTSRLLSLAASEMADRYRATVNTVGAVDEFGITTLDRTGVAVWTVALWPDGGSLPNGVGYGLDVGAARRGAWAEAVEVVWAAATVPLQPAVEGSYVELTAVHGGDAVLDPRRACLEAGTGWNPDARLHWRPMRREADGAPVLVPAELVASSAGDLAAADRDGLVTPITNGHGAGENRERALAHALCELVQRDGNAVAFRALDRGVVLDLDEVHDPATLSLLERLDAEGIDVVVKLAADDLGLVSLYAAGADRDPQRAPHPLAITACGEAAHPDREVALRKALTELCAARARKPFNHGPLALSAPLASPGYLERVRAEAAGRCASEEPRALRATLDWLGRSARELRACMAPMLDHVSERRRFSTLPTTEVEEPHDVLEVVTGLLREAGLGEILVLDLRAPSGTQPEGVAAVKALVPGLECETGSYARLGERGVRRLLAHPLPEVRALVLVGADGGNRARVALTEVAEQRLGGPAWLDRAGLDALVDEGYALYREPGRHVAALALEETRR